MDGEPRPDWFVSDPLGPHRQSIGLVPGTDRLAAYCRRDGQKWPCKAERERADAGR